MKKKEQKRLYDFIFEELDGNILKDYLLIISQIIEADKFVEPEYGIDENGEGAIEIILGPMNNLEKACWTFRDMLEKVEYSEDRDCSKELKKDMLFGIMNDRTIYASALNRFDSQKNDFDIFDKNIRLVFRQGYQVAVYQSNPQPLSDMVLFFPSNDQDNAQGGGTGGRLN